MEEEIWKPVIGFEEYAEVSNKGRVRALPRVIYNSHYNPDKGYTRPSFIMKGSISQYGYPVVKVKKLQLIHRMVAMAFIQNPENKPQVNHKNGIKTDNRVENLEWVTNQENCNHAWETGLSNMRGPDCPISKFSYEQVDRIRKEYSESQTTYSSLARKYNVAPSTMAEIIKNKTYKS